MQPTHTRVNQSGISPTVRKAGTYQIRLDHCGYHGTCVVYRKAPGQHVAKVVTHVRAATTRAALTEARRNVRNARKAGGL